MADLPRLFRARPRPATSAPTWRDGCGERNFRANVALWWRWGTARAAGGGWYRPGVPGLHRWELFADTLLHLAAHERRWRWNQGFDVHLGTVVHDEDLDRFLAELPTFSSPVWSPDDHIAAEREDLADALERLRDDLHTPEPGDDDPFDTLVDTLGLSALEREIVAVVAAIAWHPTRLRLIGYVQDDLTAGGAMVSTLSRLLSHVDDGVLRALAPNATLRRSCVVRVAEGGQPGSAIVTLAPEVLWHLAGRGVGSPDLPADVELRDGEPAGKAPRLSLVHGGDRLRRLEAASDVTGTGRLLVMGEPDSDRGWEAAVCTALCQRAVLALELDAMTPAARRWIARVDTVPWVVSSRYPLTLTDLPAVRFVEREAPDTPADDAEVHRVLGGIPGGHRLSADQLDRLALADELSAEQAVRRLASGELDHLATRIRPRRTWDDLVVPAHQLAQLKEIVARVKHRAKVFDDWGFRAVPSAGVLVLFSGPSGTGKTMSSEIIAGELGLDMFKIDLSMLVDKYIGETEKNLERVFAAAEGGGVLLVFDEADAVFGKRTKVSDSHDRYANVQTSYLLARLESYDGLAVLTTNLAGNIDQAFMRRLHASVEFKLPEEQERLLIWRSAFPSTAPIGDVDVEFLARQFKISGGSIRNAALTAAFAAADADEPVSMRHAIHGLRREYLKLGRIITQADFAEWFDAAAGDSAAAG